MSRCQAVSRLPWNGRYIRRRHLREGRGSRAAGDGGVVDDATSALRGAVAVRPPEI